MYAYAGRLLFAGFDQSIEIQAFLTCDDVWCSIQCAGDLK